MLVRLGSQSQFIEVRRDTAGMTYSGVNHNTHRDRTQTEPWQVYRRSIIAIGARTKTFEHSICAI